MSAQDAGEQAPGSAELDPSFEHLLLFLKEERGFDFTGYKRPSLMRRVRHAMRRIDIDSFDDYCDYLQVHPDEFVPLFNTILINVTAFFRDADAWRQLVEDVIPALVDASGEDAPIRLWSAGCATGQEAYSLAMVLAEHIGIDAFCQRVKIYGTDVDEEALAIARQAIYTEPEVEDIPAALRDKYFDQSGNRYVFHKQLRRCVIFGRNDLVQDAPIGRLDLLACRNTLMYFNAESQARIVSRFGFALKPGGVLFLGKAEMLTNQNGVFQAVDLKRRIFRRVGLPDGRYPAPAAVPLDPPVADPPADDAHTLRTAAFLASPVAQVVLDHDYRLQLMNARAAGLLRLSERDLGRPFSELEVSYRPAELRSHVEQVLLTQSVDWLRDVEWFRAAGERIVLDIQLVPLTDVSGPNRTGVAIVFHDVTRFRRLQEEVEGANRQLENAYEELQSTNEELETTNEELQSTVEELETTNEELQSTNEELETMNEELQSMNDELQSTNEILRQRTDEISSLNAFMESVLSSLGSAVIALDADLRVHAWNKMAEDLWGIREDEVLGQRVADIDSQMPVDQLRPLIHDVTIRGERIRNVAIEAVNRRGRPVRLQVSVLPLSADGSGSSGALILMDADEPA